MAVSDSDSDEESSAYDEISDSDEVVPVHGGSVIVAEEEEEEDVLITQISKPLVVRKKRKITDFFQRCPNSSKLPEIPSYLRSFNPRDVHRRARRANSATKSRRASCVSETIEKATKARGVYKSYTLKQKMEIVRYARQSSEAAASTKYGVPRATIYGWRNIDKQPISKKFSKHKRGAGRQISYPKEIEDELLAWVLKQRDLQAPVRRQDIQRKAVALIKPTNPNFKASSGWVDKFMIRHELSIRAKTSIQQKLPAQLEEKLEKFIENVKTMKEAHKFSDDMIINMDETPMYFDMPRSHSISKKGVREVRIRSTGAEKRRLTVILACTASGMMLPPMVIFKGKRALKKITIPPGVVVTVQPKAWNDSALTKLWIQKILSRYTMKQHALLVWDTFSGHMTEEVQEELQKQNISVVVVPGGCTSKIQPLDVCLNKPFKSYCRAQWTEYMQEAVGGQQPGERIKTPTKDQIIRWVVQANDSLGSNSAMVRKSFLVCGISNKLDGSDNSLIRCSKELEGISIAYGCEATQDNDTDSEDPFASDAEDGIVSEAEEKSSGEEEEEKDEES